MSSTSSRNIVKMSAAGSGKTYDICKDALEAAGEGKRVLITTYTNRGKEAVKNEVRKQNDGVLHPLVVIKTWYSFLMSDLIKPYQKYLTDEVNGVKGIVYPEHSFVNRNKKGSKERYITPRKDVISSYAAELAYVLDNISDRKVISRLEEVYDTVFFDEIQDLAGYDIDIIKMLIESSASVVCCGDNKQATFSTHNTIKNKKKTGKNVWEFFKELEGMGLVDVERNLASRRFNSQICSFANKVFPAGDPITTIMNDVTDHDGVFLIDSADVEVYYQTFSPRVMRYDKRTDAFGYPVINFGACKGETFDRVLIVPNGPFEKFIKNGEALSSPEKYYVAVTRPRYSIAFVFNKLPRKLDGYEDVTVSCDEREIRALKYKPEA